MENQHLFPFDRTAAAKLLNSPDTKASVLLAISLAAYGANAVFGDVHEDIEPWDPIMLYNQLENDFRAKLPNENENRLQGIILGISSELFFDQPDSFVAIVGALNDGDIADAIDGSLDEITLPEIMWAGLEIELSRDDRQEYGPQVLSLIDSIAANEREDADASDVDELAKEPYYVRYLKGEFEELIEQFRQLGVDEKTLDMLKHVNLSFLATKAIPD